MNHLSAWITKQEDIERDCEALGGIVHDTEIPIVVDAMIRIIGAQEPTVEAYLPWKNLLRDETRQKIPSTLVIVCDTTHKVWSQHAKMTCFSGNAKGVAHCSCSHARRPISLGLR